MLGTAVESQPLSICCGFEDIFARERFEGKPSFKCTDSQIKKTRFMLHMEEGNGEEEEEEEEEKRGKQEQCEKEREEQELRKGEEADGVICVWQ
ncbi:uncharacterized protein MONOS_18226 [Monocercomonoides exilis]|uniref:uncharacterized protein n=1 Tax=Monocercomonoides exilis TaxID=2049356 RepID=UPI00355AC2BC|nr:hypothetical protein MONOS_18226 [Monocercomonoides exilis]